MLFMLDMKVCLRGGRDRMRKLSVILVGMMASLLLAHLAWPGEIEVLYEGQWKILKTELVSGREYVPLAQVAKITGGGVLRDGLRGSGGPSGFLSSFSSGRSRPGTAKDGSSGIDPAASSGWERSSITFACCDTTPIPPLPDLRC